VSFPHDILDQQRGGKGGSRDATFWSNPRNVAFTSFSMNSEIPVDLIVFGALGRSDTKWMMEAFT